MIFMMALELYASLCATSSAYSSASHKTIEVCVGLRFWLTYSFDYSILGWVLLSSCDSWVAGLCWLVFPVVRPLPRPCVPECWLFISQVLWNTFTLVRVNVGVTLRVSCQFRNCDFKSYSWYNHSIFFLESKVSRVSWPSFHAIGSVSDWVSVWMQALWSRFEKMIGG